MRWLSTGLINPSTSQQQAQAKQLHLLKSPLLLILFFSWTSSLFGVLNCISCACCMLFMLFVTAGNACLHCRLSYLLLVSDRPVTTSASPGSSAL
ncbi:hypothetical protein BDW72DRAFT_118207 [Aspergillus terricola var. indicus]